MEDRFRGSLLGLALCDAFGTTMEFQANNYAAAPALLAADAEALEAAAVLAETKRKDEDDEGAAAGRAAAVVLRATAAAAPVVAEAPAGWQVRMVGDGPFSLLPGQWTDDTTLALCMAESFVMGGGTFDPRCHLRRYSAWYRSGHASPTGVCFDIGVGTRLAIQRGEKDRGERYPATSDETARIGNGSLMRLAPAVLATMPLVQEDKDACWKVDMADVAGLEACLQVSGDSSRTTHGAAACVSACRYYAGLIVGACAGVSKAELLAESPPYSPVPGLWEREPLEASIAEVAGGSYKRREPPDDIIGKGDVVNTLQAVLWAFHRSSSFETGLFYIANLGNDADTTAAIYGQLAGAFYGRNAFPAPLAEPVAHGEFLTVIADELLAIRQEAAGAAGTADAAPAAAAATAAAAAGGGGGSDDAAGTATAARRTPSQRFLQRHACFSWLEAEHKRVILRKCDPGPRMYRQMAELDADAADLETRFQAWCATPVQYVLADPVNVPDTDTHAPVNPVDLAAHAENGQRGEGVETSAEATVLTLTIEDEARDATWAAFAHRIDGDRARIRPRVG